MFQRTDFIMKNHVPLYPDIVTSGLVLYYDITGKRNDDKYKDLLLDMSGNSLHGQLKNFSFTQADGYNNGLQMSGTSYVERPLIDSLLSTGFTYQLNDNIITYSQDTVKWVREDRVFSRKGINYLQNSNFISGTQNVIVENGSSQGGVNKIIIAGNGGQLKLTLEVPHGAAEKDDLLLITSQVKSPQESTVSVGLESIQEQLLSTFTSLDGGVWNKVFSMQRHGGGGGTAVFIGDKPLTRLKTSIGNRVFFDAPSSVVVGNSAPTKQQDYWLFLNQPLSYSDISNILIIHSPTTFQVQVRNLQLINLTKVYGKGLQPQVGDLNPLLLNWTPNPTDLLKTCILYYNILQNIQGDKENSNPMVFNSLKLYNRPLSNQQMLQNYRVQKQRFST